MLNWTISSFIHCPLVVPVRIMLCVVGSSVRPSVGRSVIISTLSSLVAAAVAVVCIGTVALIYDLVVLR